MTTLMVVFGTILLVFLGYTLVVPTFSFLPRHLRPVDVYCPYLKTSGRVRLKAMRAALWSAYGLRNLRVRACTLMGGRVNCNEACLQEKGR